MKRQAKRLMKKRSKPGGKKRQSVPKALVAAAKLHAKLVKGSPWPERGIDATGFALIHKKSRRIVLATIRADKKMTMELGKLYQVNGSYRVASVIVREQ